MVIINNGHDHIGKQVEAQVQTLLQTGAGVIVFARNPSAGCLVGITQPSLPGPTASSRNSPGP